VKEDRALMSPKSRGCPANGEKKCSTALGGTSQKVATTEKIGKKKRGAPGGGKASRLYEEKKRPEREEKKKFDSDRGAGTLPIPRR